MTDKGRAYALVGMWSAQKTLTDADADLLEQEFAAVRADERQQIVAWLRDRTFLSGLTDLSWETLHVAADQIERGEHAR